MVEVVGCVVVCPVEVDDTVEVVGVVDEEVLIDDVFEVVVLPPMDEVVTGVVVEVDGVDDEVVVLLEWVAEVLVLVLGVVEVEVGDEEVVVVVVLVDVDVDVVVGLVEVVVLVEVEVVATA